MDKSNRQKVVDFIQKYRHNKSVVFVLDDKPFLEMLKIGTTFKVREEGERLVRGKRNLPVG